MTSERLLAAKLGYQSGTIDDAAIALHVEPVLNESPLPEADVRAIVDGIEVAIHTLKREQKVAEVTRLLDWALLRLP